jgi:hypothetical protein
MKQQLPGNAAKDKKDFLADVVAFANTRGGVLLYGIETLRDSAGNDTGVANRIAGLGTVNADKEKQRLLAMLHDGISPSLASSVVVQNLEVDGASGPVIALGVSQSLSRPHMVTFEGSSRFFRRSDTGKYQPDMSELRSLFLETKSWIEDAEEFRAGRLERVRSGQAVPKLVATSGVLIHILPLGRLTSVISMNSRGEELGMALPPPEYRGGFGMRYNLDGCIASAANSQDNVTGYTQWFRFGGVEGYESGISGFVTGDGAGKIPRFWANQTAKTILAFVPQALAAISAKLQIDPPFVVMLTLFGLAGSMIYNEGRVRQAPTPFTDDLLHLPPVIVEDPSEAADKILRPLLDIVWQTGGHPEAPKTF